MQLYQIDSFEELEQEKKRLKAELRIAKEGLNQQLAVLPMATKQGIANFSSFSTIAKGLASLGISKLAKKEGIEAQGAVSTQSPVNWPNRVMAAVQDYRKSPTRALLNLLPVVLPLLQNVIRKKDESDLPLQRKVSDPVLPHKRADLLATEQNMIHKNTTAPPLQTKTPAHILVGNS